MGHLDSLPPRLRQTAELIIMGFQYKTIAEQMGIRHSTVKNYALLIYDRTGAASRHELATWVGHERKQDHA